MANRRWSKTLCMSERSSRALRGTSIGSISGRGATPYWNIVFCRNQSPSVRGTRWACSVPSMAAVKRQEMSRAGRASVRLPWRGNARPAGVFGTLNCDQTGGSLPCGKRQCAKVGTSGYFAVVLSLCQLGWTKSLLCRPTFRVARQTEVVFLAPQDAVSRCQDSASAPLFAQEAIPAVCGDNGAGDESGLVMKTSLRVVQRRQNHYDVVLVRVAWMPGCHSACHIVGNVLSAILMCRSSKKWP